MSRFSKAERRVRRQALEVQAALGDDWLSIREAGTFLAEGYSTWEAFVHGAIVPTIPPSWRFTTDQTGAFVAEALRLAEIRRRHGTRAARCR